jgi:hypothetical protein
MDAGEVMAAYAAAWERGDPEAAFRFYDEHVTMRVPGRGRLAGLHEGREAVIETIRAFLAQTSGNSATVDVLDRMVSPYRVGMFVRETVRRGEDTLELRRVNLYQVRDDKIVAIDIFEGDQYDVDEFFD